jgi:hypothetical protein
MPSDLRDFNAAHIIPIGAGIFALALILVGAL